MKVTIPNQITLARLGLAIVFFVLLSFYSTQNDQREWILSVAFWLFLAAALGDFLDGYLARRLGQVTAFGRVVDPVVDKVMVCGAFVFFCGVQFYDPATQKNVTGVQPWMAVVVLLRELFVSAIRAFSESRGTDFPALWSGKIKMFVQAATVCIILGVLAWFEETLAWLRVTAIWATVIATALSISSYVRQARGTVFTSAALGGASAEPDRTDKP